jgi:hypothetical protein|tara:strand:- start:770 stop:1036 length:267 start_codon:yes stop_codon:yes gene_type:complete
MIENISTDHLEERKAVVNNDISVVKQRLQDYETTKAQIEQKKLEDVGLLNALTGALQQIDLFLNEIHNEEAVVEEAIASDVENSSEED